MLIPPTASDAWGPACELVGDASAQIMSISVAPVEYRSFLPGRRLWRVSGEVSTHGELRRFALVAKDVVGSSVESVVYESEVLKDLSGCILAPRFVGRQSFADGQRLWLEEVPDDQPGRWDYYRCVRVAGCLGWLTSELHQQAPPAGVKGVWEAQVDDVEVWAVAIQAVEQLIEDRRLARPWYSLDTLHRILNLLHKRDLFVSASRRLPAGLAHADCGRHNLHLRQTSGGIEQYYLMDWEEAVIGPLGLDLAAFVNGTLITGSLDPEVAQDFHRAAEAEYVGVLANSPGDSIAEDAILGYRIHSTLRWAPHIHGASALAGRSTRVSFSRHWNESFEPLMERRVKLTDLFLTRGESLAQTI